MAEIGKITWSSDEYTLEKFVELFPLPQAVRIKTNLKGNNENKGQPGKMPPNDVFILHSVRHKEVIRATDALKNEFYLPHDSTAKVEVVWQDYKKVYDNVSELLEHFPLHVLVVEDDETLGIKKGDVLKLKRKIKIRENSYLKCVLLDANGVDVDIPFSYKGLFRTLGDLTTENIPLKEAVEFCRLPRNVKFIDDKLRIKRIDGTSKCPTLLSSLDHVTLHEVLDHIDVIASQSSDGQVVVSSIPLDEDVIVIAPTVESRGDPDYTQVCQLVDKKTTAEMVKAIGVLHQHWIVFQEDCTKRPSSWNQQLFSLASLGNQRIPHVKDGSASVKAPEAGITLDKDAPCLPRKMQATVLKKQGPPPPIPPRIPLQPRMGQGRNLTPPPPRRRAASDPDDPGSLPTSSTMKAKTLPRILIPSQSTPSNDEGNYQKIRFPIELSKSKPQSSHQVVGNTQQDVERIIKERFEPDNLEGEDGYVKMSGEVPHRQSKYDLLYQWVHGQAQPDYSNLAGRQESKGHHLQLHERERSKSSTDLSSETGLKVKKDHTRLQKRRSFDPKENPRQTQGSTFPRGQNGQSHLGLMENRMPPECTQESFDSDDAVHLKIRFEEPSPNRGVYSDVPSLMANADRRNQLPMLKHSQKMTKAPPGLDFINTKTIRSWSPDEVLKFLKFINLEKYKKVFKKNKIDGEILVNMDKKGLHELKVTHTHAATVLKLVHECIKHESSTIPNQYVP